MKNLKQSGFTIVELLIATTVFATMMVIVSGILLQITRQYYKGITASKTQEVARSITNDISQAIQFSKTSPGDNSIPGERAWCVGEIRYSYVVSTFRTSSNHVFWKDQNPGCSAPIGLGSISAGTSGKELLNENMALADLTITPVSNLYKIDITVVSAVDTDDLVGGVVNSSVQCKSGSGSQFCAVSHLTTYVQKRL